MTALRYRGNYLGTSTRWARASPAYLPRSTWAKSHTCWAGPSQAYPPTWANSRLVRPEPTYLGKHTQSRRSAEAQRQSSDPKLPKMDPKWTQNFACKKACQVNLTLPTARRLRHETDRPAVAADYTE